MQSSRWQSVLRRGHESALEVFRRLPTWSRRLATHTIAPSYSVGAVALCVDDDRVLLVRSRHQRAWSLPGGLLSRGETPAQALIREMSEELSFEIGTADIDGEPSVVVDPESRQVTVIFRIATPARPKVDGVEVVKLGWFTVDELPSRLVRGTAESLRLMGFLT